MNQNDGQSPYCQMPRTQLPGPKLPHFQNGLRIDKRNDGELSSFPCFPPRAISDYKSAAYSINPVDPLDKDPSGKRLGRRILMPSPSRDNRRPKNEIYNYFNMILIGCRRISIPQEKMIMCEQKDLNASLLGNRSGVCGSGADTLKKNLPLSLRFIVRLWAASSVENEIPR
jgi:hypothetical protein